MTQPIEGIILAPEDTGGLVTLRGRDPQEIFTTPGIPQAVVAMIQEAALADFTPDLTTEKGRKEIASRAFRVTRTKTYLDDLGKEAVAKLKELPKQIDAGRKVVRDGLDELRDQIRKPLDEWEAAETTRVQRHQINLQDLQETGRRMHGRPSGAIRAALTKLQFLVIGPDWEEFEEEAKIARAAAEAELTAMAAEAKKREDDQEELARLREEKAKREAEDAARQRAAAEAAEAQLKAEAERVAALRRAKEAEEAAERRAQEAVEAERRRVEAERLEAERREAVAREEARKLAEDQEHRRAFNREALADIQELIRNAIIPAGMDGEEVIGKAVLAAIVLGKVRHVSITY